MSLQKTSRIKVVLHIIQAKIVRFFMEPEVFGFDLNTEKKKGKGFITHNGREFVHHTGLATNETAFSSLYPKQKFFLLGFFGLLALCFILNWHLTLLVLFAVMTAFYFVDLVFNLFLILRNFFRSPEVRISAEEIANSQIKEWPTYTIFCPLYKEWQVVPQFVKAINELDYPKNKLQVMLLLEQDDQETIQKIQSSALPEHFEVVVVPHSMPKTKPKAMNYGLKFAKGEYIVIYDAEDAPEGQQLKKAVLAFAKLPPETVCVQAKLNFYNPHQNLLTRVFTAEYSLWFDLILTGLQSINAPIPLGGTSNHFRTKDIKSLLGWDAFNVTEDCDLGMRLSKRGFKTAIMDSTTLEEANSGFKNWYRQRSRWIKGYIQTYMVHMRRPQEFLAVGGVRNLAFFQLLVGGKILSMFINPFLWVITALYFLQRAQLGPFIESFFPGPVLYIGVACFVFGNFLYLYYYMIGCAKKGHFSIIKYAFLVPFYWLFMSASAWQALYEVVVKPHYWAKTLHGLHLEKEPMPEEAANAWSLKNLAKQHMGSGGFLMASLLLANFFNFLLSAYLGRVLALEDFGVIAVFNMVAMISGLVISALATTVNHRVAYLGSKYGNIAGMKFFRMVNRHSWIAALIMAGVWLALVPGLAKFFHISGLMLVFFMPVITFGLLAAPRRGFLQGTLRFKSLGVVVVAEAFTKLVAGVLLSRAGLGSFVALSLPVSITFAWLLAVVLTRRAQNTVLESQSTIPTPIKGRNPSTIGSAEKGSFVASAPQDGKLPTFAFPRRFMAASILTGLSSTAFLSLDVLLAKHYLSPSDAGAYSLLSLTGNMVFFLGSLLSVFIVTYVSKKEGEGQNPNGIFYSILAGMLVMVGGAFAVLGVFGAISVPLLFGQKALSIVPYLSVYTGAASFFTLANAFIAYHLARKHYLFSFWALFMASVMGLGIVFNHGSILGITKVVLAVSMFNFGAVILLHFLQRNGRFVLRNLVDLWDAFAPLRNTDGYGNTDATGKRILIFNWRDTKHAFAGGAEIYIHELAKRWVQMGNHVTLFCGNDGQSKREEMVDGVRVIRRGGFYFVYVWAFVYYLTKFRGRYDIIVDAQNGIPFFTPLYAKEKVIAVLHHIHQEVFYKYLPRPLAFVAAVLENRVMPMVYARTKFITVSESSKEEMQKWGIGQAGIEVVHPGVDLELLEPGERHKEPVVTYLGRLKAYKSVDVLIRAFWYVAAQLEKAKLVIAGDGEERGILQKLVEDLGLKDRVVFTGKISESEKLEILQKSWVFCNPSMMEGWGITSIEANACGVPVVASNVPGLRESVQNPHTGFLVEHGNIEKFAEKIHLLLTDKTLQKFMHKESLQWASNFSWDKSAEKSLEVLNA